MTDFRLLGPVEVWTSAGRLDTGPPQRRLVLAALLAEPARLVTAETLITRVWGEQPPAGARRALHVHIARIRRMLRPAALARGSGGYVLEIDPDRVDLHRFRRLTARAAEPGRAGSERLALLREALAQWRGAPLAGLPGHWADQVRENWSRRHADAVIAWAHAEIDAGDPGAAVDALADLAEDYPLVEPVTAALMLALHSSGRGAEALDRYARARRRLVDELGIEPGAELAELHRAVLRGDARPPAPAPAVATRTASDSPTTPESALPSAGPFPAVAAVPVQLPPDVPGFAGRRTELATLTAAAAERALVVVSGTAGVGKTALTVHWATGVASRYPGGLLYLNLRGYDPTGSAMKPAEAVRTLLAAFDVPAPRLPVTLPAQISLYRRLIAGRRALVLLDNARDADQVRPLLPTAPGCLALVTSRNQLPALVATDGAYPMTLDLLSVAESRQLLAARLGAARLAAEPQSVDEIIDRCARLPLAMALVATRAAVHPRFALSALVHELREAGGRLDALTSVDPAIDVRTVLSWSYRRLTAGAAELFGLLGVHGGPDITANAAAALLGVPVRRVTPLLAELADAHLVVEHAEGRFGLHDLLRAYAAEQSPGTGTAALRRVLDYYVHSAYVADGLLYPHRDEFALDPPVPGLAPETFTGARDATAWLAAERTVLLAAVDQAAAAFPGHALRIALALVTFLDRQGYWHEQIAALHHAHDAARRLGDTAGQGHTLRILGLAHARLGRYAEAGEHILRALELFDTHGDRDGQARAHRDLASLCWRQDRRAGALHHLRRTLDLSQTAGLRAGGAFTLYALACSHFLSGEHQRAVQLCRRSIAAYQELGDRVGEAVAWEGRGHAHREMGHHRQALICYRRTLRLRQEIGDRYLEADSLLRIGDTHEAAGRREQACAAWLAAYDILGELGHPDADLVKERVESCRSG